MTTEEIKEMLSRYHSGACTDLEKRAIEESFMKFNEDNPNLSQQQLTQMDKNIRKNIPALNMPYKTSKIWPIISTAAAIAIIGIGIWIYAPERPLVNSTSHVYSIKPGGKRATVTLSNGQQISLSADKKGLVVAPTSLSYNDGSIINAKNLTGIQTISTPKGGEYEIVLSDGTWVWLNSSTTLQYSTDLKEGGKRKVKLVTGEAYFEVAKDKRNPFVVSTGRQEVMVLGTHFNINAYSSDRLKTTLIEGSVKVTAASNNSKVLSPGQQAINTGATLTVNEVDTDIELAWKRGKIQFLKSDLKSVLEMVSRWYDVEIVYQYYPIDSKFTGSISRSKNISEVLNLLETTGEVHFKIDERRILVMK